MSIDLPTTLKLPSLDTSRRASAHLSVDLARPVVKDGACALSVAVNNYFKRLGFLSSCQAASAEKQRFDLPAQTEIAKQLVHEAMTHMATEFGVGAETMRAVVQTALEERGFRGRPSVERLSAIRDEAIGAVVG